MSCAQYRDSRLNVQTLTVTSAASATSGPGPITATFQRLRLIDSCGRAAVCDGEQNDGYSTTQEFFYDYPIFLNQPALDPGLYFLLLAPVCCPCAVRVHGLVVGADPSGNPWPATGLEGHSNRCRSGQDLPYVLPTVNSVPTGADGQPGDPATITCARAVTGGPAANEEQLVTLGPGNCFGLGETVIGNDLWSYALGASVTVGVTLVPASGLITPGVLIPGVQFTREDQGFRVGYSGVYARQSIALPTVSGTNNGLRSATIPRTGSEGYLYVTGVFDSGPGQYTLGASAGCTGALGGTATSNDGSQTLTVAVA